MTKPRIKPGPVDDVAPTENGFIDYDRLHLVTYLRLLDADAAGADRNAIAREVLQVDPSLEPERGQRAYESHLERARWMTRVGYRHLLVDDQLGKPEASDE